MGIHRCVVFGFDQNLFKRPVLYLQCRDVERVNQWRTAIARTADQLRCMQHRIFQFQDIAPVRVAGDGASVSLAAEDGIGVISCQMRKQLRCVDDKIVQRVNRALEALKTPGQFGFESFSMRPCRALLAKNVVRRPKVLPAANI